MDDSTTVAVGSARVWLAIGLSVVTYCGIILLVASWGPAQAALVYLHWVRAPWVDLTNLRRFHLAGWARNIVIVTKDRKELRGWHLLPGGGDALAEAMTGEGCHGEDERRETTQCRYDRALARPDARIVIYFHGNALSRGYPNRVERAKAISAHALAHVLLVDYRGFGGSTGYPSEVGVAEDARSIVRWVRQRAHSSANIFLLGQSLGSGVAVRLAAEMYQEQSLGRPAGLILDAAYRTIIDAAASHPTAFPFRLVPPLRRYLFSKSIDQWNSIQHIQRVQCPILILHGEQDWKIPIDQGKELHASAQQSRRLRARSALDGNSPRNKTIDDDPDHVHLVALAGAGHSDLQSHPSYMINISNFIRTHVLGPDQARPFLPTTSTATCGVHCMAERGIHQVDCVMTDTTDRISRQPRPGSRKPTIPRPTQ